MKTRVFAVEPTRRVSVGTLDKPLGEHVMMDDINTLPLSSFIEDDVARR